MQKKKWAKPKLIVLVRGGHEQEMATLGCKGAVEGGWSTDWTTCGQPPDTCGAPCTLIWTS